MRNPREQRHTVLIADDHPVVAEGLTASLRERYVVVGCVTRLSQVAHAIRDSKPDVAIIDVSLEGTSALPVVKQLTSDASVRTRFVVLTGLEGGALGRAAFEAGATGFLLKGSGTAELLMAVEAALEGRRYSTGDQEEVDVPRHGRQWLVGGVRITLHQARVLCAVLDHGQRTQAAKALGLTPRGVDYHLDELRSRLGIASLTLLIRWAGDNEPELRAVGRVNGEISRASAGSG